MDFGWVDLDVDLLCTGGIGLQVAGHPVVEAHAEGQQQVGVLDRQVAVGLAVHAHHAQAERMRGREAAQSQQGAGHRRLGLLGKLPQLLHRAGHQHAMPGQDHRALGLRDQAPRRAPYRLSGRAAAVDSRAV